MASLQNTTSGLVASPVQLAGLGRASLLRSRLCPLCAKRRSIDAQVLSWCALPPQPNGLAGEVPM